MHVLLTGSAGFLGRNLYGYLSKRGHTVIGLDKIDSPTTDVKFNFVSPVLRPYIYNKKVDAVIHVGGIADVYEAACNPKEAYRVNITGTHELVVLCKDMNIPMIYTSTWEVYGTPLYEPLDENHPTVPDHPYNISKLAGELVVRNKLQNINHCVLRLGTLYGNGMRKSAVIPKFIDMAHNKQDITIHGTGAQYRQFTHVEDVCRAFLTVLEEKADGVYNVVSREKVSINDLVNILRCHFPEMHVIHQEVREADAPSSIVSSDKIKNELGWEPQIDFRQGLLQMIQE